MKRIRIESAENRQAMPVDNKQSGKMLHGYPVLPCNGTDVVCSQLIFFCSFQMLYHQGNIIKFAKLSQKSSIIHASKSRSGFSKLRCVNIFPDDHVLGMAAPYMGTQFPEAIPDHLSVVEEYFGTCDHVHGIQVNCKPFPVNGLKQPEVGIR